MKKILLLLALCGAMTTVSAQKPRVIAHRGFHAVPGSARNTISSLRNAQNLGVYGSEFDINMTCDDSLVVVHGPWHHDKKDPQRVHVQNDDYKTVRSHSCENGLIIPSLREHFEQAAKDPETRLIVEIKTHQTPERETQVTEGVVAMLKEFGLLEKSDFISFSSFICDELVRLVPGSSIAYLTGDFDPDECKRRGYTGIDYSMTALREHPEWIERCHEIGLTVNVWTVNTPEDIAYFIGRNVDFITTDNPLEAMKQLGMTPKNCGSCCEGHQHHPQGGHPGKAPHKKPKH